MDDSTIINEEKPFSVDRPKQGRAACKKCKEKCAAGELRIAKLVPSPYDISSKMKSWHHVDCIFEQFQKQRVNTKRIESPDDIDGYDNLNDEDQKLIFNKIYESEKTYAEKHNLKVPVKKDWTKKKDVDDSKPSTSNKKDQDIKSKSSIQHSLFKDFRRLIADITNESSYLKKSKTIEKLFKNNFKGDIRLWCHLLLPGVVKRVYNLQSKQLIKLFSKIFHTKQSAMMEHLKEGDVSDTIQVFFEESKAMKPSKKSTLTLENVDQFLEELSQLTKEEEQTDHFKKIVPKCTTGDLKVIIRLVKGDLRMNAGAKHILDGIHPDAYTVYQSSRDLNAVINKCIQKTTNKSPDAEINIKASITLLTPVLPMLAQACKSVKDAMKKCPNGMFSEIKYDGERVQVHKKGSEFKYYSRNLKPVLAHKVEHFKKYIPKAFPHADDLILDSEILMVDTATGQPLPFGTLGKHKKNEFSEATVCLFIFDCIYYNGKDLSKQPIKDRKEILHEKMIEIPNHIMFSEMLEIKKENDLTAMIKRVLKDGLEGLVLKDTQSIYEPGKRHWLKIKKDYLCDGAMADSADLIVLGAWYGTGKKGGMMSTFLMGCYDKPNDIFVTVTKVHTGHDDATLERLQKELVMSKISCNPSKVPTWLKCNRQMTPDFVASDPRKQPVWQIIGAEFTKHEVHTADGISIRFPRVAKIRSDKNWESATNLQELHNLFEVSKTNTDIIFDDDEETSVKSETASNTSKETIIDYNINGNKKRKNETVEDVEIKKIKRETTEVDLLNPIPRYFDGISLYPADKLNDELSKWLRYFVAYGGIILHNNFDKAQYVLHLKKETDKLCDECPKNIRHVHVEWIKQSIIKKSLRNSNLYSVKLLSNDYQSTD